ncbi:MAG: trypsin-like peptidase domain-containing protein [Verrucomicrobiae bacterium]|nr:trypsin-like peptidase domain-containing protein [Verrucomicrobiae bacterium]
MFFGTPRYWIGWVAGGLCAVTVMGFEPSEPVVFPRVPDRSVFEERAAPPPAQGEVDRRAPAEPDFPAPVPGQRGAVPAGFEGPTPDSVADLAAMEAHVMALVRQVTPSVVAVRVGGSTGSGVVISADGWVLTAAHVAASPNRPVRFLFPDGRTVRGRTLGTNHRMDAGLARIEEDGDWPWVPVGEAGSGVLGEWVLGLGHPGGFDPDRSMVVRLGRVIRRTAMALQTDSILSGGDSGGPLFDMHGRVVGIHSRISNSTAENYHVPIDAYLEDWVRLIRGENWGQDDPAIGRRATGGGGSR